MRWLAGLVASFLVGSLAAGCGGDKPSGAAAEGAAAIVGTWVFTGGTPAASASGGAGAAFEQAMKMMPKMEIEYVFAENGTFTLKEQVFGKPGSALAGTWVLRDGKYVVTETTKDGKPRISGDKGVDMELKDGELTFNPPGAPVVFHLKRK